MFDRFVALREKPALDDDELQEVIADRIDEDPVFHLSNGRRARIGVEVDGGVATLRGQVRTALDRRRADILARALGAATVDNRLRVEDVNGAAPRSSRRRASER
jgi:osmotically-inducible protein OsmY